MPAPHARSSLACLDLTDLPHCRTASHPYQNTCTQVGLNGSTSAPKTTATTTTTTANGDGDGDCAHRHSLTATHLGPGRVGQGGTMPNTCTIVPWSGCSLGPHSPKHLFPRSPGYPDSCSSSSLSHRSSELIRVSLPCAIARWTQSRAAESIGHHYGTYCTALLCER